VPIAAKPKFSVAPQGAAACRAVGMALPGAPPMLWQHDLAAAPPPAPPAAAAAGLSAAELVDTANVVDRVLQKDDARFVELQQLLNNDVGQPSIYSPQPHGVRGGFVSASAQLMCETGPGWAGLPGLLQAAAR
jgi:hypothetical protein